MSLKLLLALAASMSLPTFAADKKISRKPNQVVNHTLSVNIIKEVADAALKQHIIGTSDSLISISLTSQRDDDSTYTVKAKDKEGKCYQQSASVFVSSENEISVAVPRMPRSACE